MMKIVFYYIIEFLLLTQTYPKPSGNISFSFPTEQLIFFQSSIFFKLDVSTLQFASSVYCIAYKAGFKIKPAEIINPDAGKTTAGVIKTKPLMCLVAPPCSPSSQLSSNNKIYGSLNLRVASDLFWPQRRA